jgi:large subunit ribosomal protein L10
MVRQEKVSEVGELKTLIEKYPVVGIISMHKLPGRQLQSIRHKINAKIKMNKKTITLRALDLSGKKDILKLSDKLTGSTALIFSEESPFKLFRILKENRSPAAAKAGDVATRDITIQKGSTGLPPGPAISVLQKIGLKASVQGGKIAVLQDKVVCKPGEKISADVAGVLSLLKIEPLDIGLDMICAYEDGIIYDRSVLDVNVEDYISDIQKCVSQAVNLSVNTGYPTKLTIEMMVQKAFNETKSLCIETNVVEKDFIDDVLIKAINHAKALESKVQ